MTQTPLARADSLSARFLDTAALKPEAPALASLGRRWSYGALAERTRRLAGALARLEVGPDKRLGLLLPPVPTAAMAALAGLRLGATVVPCDPMARGDALAGRLAGVGAGVLVTLDLTRLQQRWLEQLEESTLDAVLVDKMAELLPFPRNLMAPLMRGGELAVLPRHPRTAALPRLLAAEGARAGTLQAGAQAGVLDGLADGAPGRHADAALRARADALLDLAGGAGRWLLAQHLADARSLTALLAPLAAGREAILLPRLDARTIANALAQERPRVAVLSHAVAETLLKTPPPGGLTELAVVPESLAADRRDALAEAVGARVAVWPETQAPDRA